MINTTKSSALTILAFSIILSLTMVTQATAATLFVSSNGTNQILKYDTTSGASLGVFANLADNGKSNPRELAIGPDGNLYVLLGASEVIRYNATSGAYLGEYANGTDSTIVLANATDLTFTPTGNLLVGQYNANTIVQYTAPHVNALFGPTSSELIGLTYGPSGDLYAMRDVSGPNQVQRRDGTTGAVIGTVITGYANSNSGDLVFGGNANSFYSIEAFNSGVQRNAATFGSATDVITGRSGLQEMIIGLDGNLYLSETGTDSILKYDTVGGGVTTFIATGSGGLSDPWGLAILEATEAVPEPSTLVLAALGLMGLGCIAWKKRLVRG
ncbi:MAG: PEP-CTERM sorting domain-containing protein [Planctomycetes bacterium]|nr:PEP-CTERM sorting domain-containing protein [Planctomycetota bacterium]